LLRDIALKSKNGCCSLEICKEHLLMTTLFEEPDTKEYFDNMSELRRQNLANKHYIKRF
jgi:hypothetical protein